MEGMSKMETCYQCMGSGYGGHPDSGYVCFVCRGSGGVKITAISQSLREADYDTNKLFDLLVEAADFIDQQHAALCKADQFITNGVELGYIRMPDLSTPDSAHDTPTMIRAAIARNKSE